VTQDDGWASLFLVAKIFLGVGACFDLLGTMQKIGIR
jgi:hypothetical protein